MKRFFITGINGSGKSTLGQALSAKGISVIDLDDVKDLCIWINKETGERKYWSERTGKEFYEENEYTCNEDMLKSLMDQQGKEIVVVVGLADNQSKLFHLFDRVFLLRCSEETFIQRMKERKSHDFGKDELEQQMVLSYYKSFEQDMLDKGTVPLDAAQPIEGVVMEFLEKITK